MRRLALSALAATLLLATGLLAPALLAAGPAGAQDKGKAAPGLKAVSDFAGIADPTARSRALFIEAGKVFTHPRCTNCHTTGDQPTRGDRQEAHQPPARRGADGLGAPLKCALCHGRATKVQGRVPTVPGWAMPPPVAGWNGKTLGAICAQIKDRQRNGDKDLAAVLKHMAEDGLVGWAFAPGPSRAPAPGSQAELAALMKAWIDTGAHCPSP